MSDGDAANFTVVFRSAAIEPGDVYVRSLHGREALSQLYEYTLEVETTFGGALEQGQIDLLLAKSAYFAFGDDESHKVHGWVREVETMSTADAARVVYRLRLVPKMFDLTLTFGSWVYQNLDAPGLVKDVLDNAKWTEGEDYEFRLTGAYTKHEYKVQYQETDFNFVSRVMEHEGLFYFFEHGDKGAKLVITDGNTAFRPREGYEHLAYETRQGISGPIEVVSALSRVQRTVPAKVSLRDYNYRTPSVPLLVDTAVERLGRLDVWVSNAGTSEHPGYFRFEEFPEWHWDAQIALNLRPHFVAARRCAEVMQPGSSIIGISSIAALGSAVNFAAYGAAKSAMNSLARTIAAELGPKGIRSNVVSPGKVPTEATRRIGGVTDDMLPGIAVSYTHLTLPTSDLV